MIALLHISDLHFGERKQQPLRSLNAQQRASRQLRPVWLPSKRGHDELVAFHLVQWWMRMVRRNPFTRIVVTGDLTRIGSGFDFGYAHRFLHAYWKMGFLIPLRCGLRAGGDQALTIPGNHDFWNGLILNPHVQRRVLDTHFWSLPWVYPISHPNRPGLEVHLVGLDSCSGLSTFPPNQTFAKGAIDLSQLNSATRLLIKEELAARRRKSLVLRVVLMHHPPDHLIQNSKQQFDAWLSSNNIHVILTGHTHRSDCLSQTQPPHYELRCGTTLQAGTQRMLPGPEPNYFFLHTIQKGKGEKDIIWQTKGWLHNGFRWDFDSSRQPVKNFIGLQP